MTGLFPLALGAAAAFERDRRADRYPARVQAGQLDAEAATADYQAWCAIHDWIANGDVSLVGVAGGQDGGMVIDWPLMEAAAHRALAQIDAKLARLDPDAPRGDLDLRRAGLFTIHHAVARRRALLADLTQTLRERARADREKAAA